MRNIMKKYIAFALALVLVIPGLLVGGFGNIHAKADGLTISDILLPADFPDNIIDSTWRNDSDKKVFTYNGFLRFSDSDELKIPLNSPIEESGGRYVGDYSISSKNVRLEFYMEDGCLSRIYFSSADSYESYRGEYRIRKYISEILPDGSVLPWNDISTFTTESGNAYIYYDSYNNELIVCSIDKHNSVRIPCNKETVKTDVGYECHFEECVGTTVKFDFNVIENKVTSIKIDYNSPPTGYIDDFKGTYANRKTIAEILPEDFPVGDKTNQWANQYGHTIIYSVSDDNSIKFDISSDDTKKIKVSEKVVVSSSSSGVEYFYSADGVTLKFSQPREALECINISGDSVADEYKGDYKKLKELSVILPSGFPATEDKSDIPVNVWANEKGTLCYTCNIGDRSVRHLAFYNYVTGFRNLTLPINASMLYDSKADMYKPIAQVFNGPYFYMENGSLSRINVFRWTEDNNNLNGNYMPATNIDNILPEYFPSSLNQAWVNSSGKSVYYDKSARKFIFDDFEIPVLYELGKDDLNYVYVSKVTDGDNVAAVTLKFQMDSNNSLSDINLDFTFMEGGSSQLVTDDYKGNYFPKESYTVTNAAKSDDESTNHGYIAIDKDSARQGETVTVTIYPSENYRLKSLPKYELSGKTYYGSKGANDNEYTFSMPDSDITITAEFEEDLTPKYDVIVSSNDEEYGSAVATVDGETVEKAAKDATVILKATPKSGYVFDHWDVTEGDVQIEDNTSFTMPDKTVKVMAVFERGTTPPEPKTYKISSTKEGASIDYDDDSLVVGIENDSEQKAYIHYDKQLNEVYITQTQDAPTEGCVDCIPVNQGETAKIVLKDCGFQLGTPIKVFKNELYGSAKPEPTPENKIPEHVHNYVWKEISAATSYSDGLEGEVCTVCGDIRNSNAISALGFAIEKYAMPMIRAAKAGQTITFEFGEWNSFPNKMMQAIAQRSKENITFVFHYKWNKKKQEVVIPAGTEFDTTLDWYGPATMQRLFGEYELKK